MQSYFNVGVGLDYQLTNGIKAYVAGNFMDSSDQIHSVSGSVGVIGSFWESRLYFFRLLPATILISNKRQSKAPLYSGVFFDGDKRINFGNLKSLVKK